LGVLMDETGDGTQGRARKSIPVNIPLPPSATLSISCCVDAPDFDRLPRHLLLTPFEKRRCPLFRGHIGNLTSQRIGALAVHGALLVVGRIPHPSSQQCVFAVKSLCQRSTLHNLCYTIFCQTTLPPGFPLIDCRTF
jgi:hypothetical protein